MSRRRGGLVGRGDALSVLDDVDGRAVLMILRGQSGAGKTAVLEEVAASRRNRGARVISIRFGADGQPWDRYGALDVVWSFRDAFDEFGDSHLAGALATVARLCTPEMYESPASRGWLLHELTRLFERFRGTVLVDDTEFAPTAVRHTLAAAVLGGCTVVVGCPDNGVHREPTPFGASAEHVIDLGPLAEPAVDELVAATLGRPLDPAVAPAVRVALGSLAGNPGAVLAVCETLNRRERLVQVMGTLCLADAAEPIVLPANHWYVRLVEEVADCGPELLTLIAGSDRFTVDDLIAFAAVTGWDLDECGRAVDELTAAGALDHTAGAVLTVACPALAAAVMAAVGPARRQELHRGIATHLLLWNHDLAFDAVQVAGHLAAAGPATVAEPAAAALLEQEATKVHTANPGLAGRWYRAALARSAPQDPSYHRILGKLLRALVKSGRYDWLAEVAAEAARLPDDDLVLHACLAAVHTGIPPSDNVIAATPVGKRTLDVTARWFSSAQPVRVEEFVAAFAPLAGAQTPIRPVAEPDYWCNPVAVLEAALGPAYGPPVAGPLALYGRIVDGYQKGRWADALSHARALDIGSHALSRVRERTRLLAAEMSACSGDVGAARQWLGEAGPDDAPSALRSWVETGVLWRSGQARAALEAGRRACTKALPAADSADLPLLIVRLAMVAWFVADRDQLAELRAEMVSLLARPGGQELDVAGLLVAAVADGSFAAAREAVDALRTIANLPALGTGCLVAIVTAEDPRPWFVELEDIATTLGDTWLRATAKSVMRARGVAPARRPVGTPSLSTVESRIISLVERGMTNRQIAAAIQVSEKSVERHLTKLFSKTGCRSRLDLVAASVAGRLVLEPWASRRHSE